MKKKELLQLPVLPLANIQGIQDKIKEKITTSYNSTYTVTKYNKVIRATVDDVNFGEPVLIVDLFYPRGKIVRRHFQNEACEYFSFDYENRRLSKAGADTWLWSYDTNYYYDGQSEQVILDFLKRTHEQSTNETAIGFLRRSNQWAKNNKLDAKHQKIIDAALSQMSQIKEVPSAVYKWAKNELMKDSRYIFYRSKPTKSTDGICSHCGKAVTIQTPKSGELGKCPACKSKVTFKPKARFLKGHGFTDRSYFAYFQPTDTGFCIRTFKVNFEFSPKGITEFATNTVSLYENERHFYELSQDRFIKQSCFGYEYSTDLGNVMAWREKDRYGYSVDQCAIYPTGLNKLLKHGKFKAFHTDFELIARRCGEINPEGIINKPSEQFLIGHFANAGLYRLTAALITNWSTSLRGVIDPTQKSVRKALDCTKEQLAIYKKLNISVSGVDLYKTLLEKHEHFDLKDFSYILARCDAGHHALRYLLSQMTLYKIVKYHSEKCFGYGFSDFLVDYKDYIENARLLDYDLTVDSVKFPRYLKQAHDIAYQTVEAAKVSDSGLQIPIIAKMEKELNDRFYYADRNYLIRAPHDHNELKQEGKILRHCVGGYAKDIAIGNSIILFIRKADDPDMPFYTLELDPLTLEINQNRGYRNNNYDTSEQKKENLQVLAWAKKWHEKIVGNKHKASA